jgi:hypothetical protein
MFGDLIVEYMLDGRDVGPFESLEEGLVCTYHFGVFSTGHGFDKYAAAIDFDHDHDVFVARQ